MSINFYNPISANSRIQKSHHTDNVGSPSNSSTNNTSQTTQADNSSNTMRPAVKNTTILARPSRPKSLHTDNVGSPSNLPVNFIDHNELLNTVSDIKDLDFDTLEISGTTNENLKITGANEKQTQALKKIFKKIPGLINTIGRQQLGHSYTVDKHILAVTKSVYNDPDFKTLDNHDKKLLLTAALMHDIQKKAGGRDFFHPQKGAAFAYQALKNLPEYTEDDRTTISNLIYNHHFNQYIDYSASANEIAKLCAKEKDPNKFLTMLKILGKADLNGNPQILQNHPNFMSKIEGKSIPMLERLVQNLTQSESTMKSQLSKIPFPFKLK